MLHFPTQKPMREEFELDFCIDMTYETPEWEPTGTYALAEQSVTDDIG
jgi:hypothetical protein